MIKAFFQELLCAILICSWYIGMFYYGLMKSPLYGD